VSRSFLLFAVLAVLVAPARPAAAQGGSPPGVPKGAPPESPDALELPPGEIRVKAESQEQLDKDHWAWRGGVDLRIGAARLLADKADVIRQEQPDGTVKQRLVAEGNVVFIRGEERLSGDRVEMDDTGRGFFDNAIGYVAPGVFVEGRRVERIDKDTYRVFGGKFTACAQPNPRWMFQASSAKIDVDDKIIAKNALFRIKGVPAFYLPIVYFPIRHDGRSTGLLFPHFGYSSTKGYEIGSGFFWAMGRSLDQTFYGDYYSNLGFGVGHELRYASASPSRGSFRTYIFNLRADNVVYDPDTGELVSGREAKRDYDLDWNALQMLPGKLRASLAVRKYSDLLFAQRFNDNFNMASTRTERFSGSIEKDLKLAVLTAYTDRTSTYFGTDYTRILGRLPGVNLRRFPRPIGWGKVVFGLAAGVDHLQYGTADALDDWTRWDFAPTVSRPLSLSFLDVNPSVGYRYTKYGSRIGVDDDGNSAIVPDPLDRSYFESALDVRGPTFARVFDTPGMGYTDRVKHTIGPEVTWTYRTRVEDANAIPKFDGADYIYGTNELRYALVQRFYAKRRGPTGKLQPWEFFQWRLMQTYYVQIKEGQNNFDPNYSSSAYGPGFQPEHLSPIQSRMRIKPTREVSVDFQSEYDVNFKQFRRQSAFLTLGFPRFSVQGNWSRSVRTSENPEERTVGSHTLRGSLFSEVIARRFFVEGSADYDLVRDTLYQMRAQVRYAVQCCGVSVEHIRYNWNGRAEKQWRFNLELAGVNSMGNFLGADAAGSRQGLGGYR
jgi:lipopolysaccharide assembly outer membrane protein LptD (OstA)